MDKQVGELGLQRFIRALIFGVSPKDLFRGAQAGSLRSPEFQRGRHDPKASLRLINAGPSQKDYRGF